MFARAESRLGRISAISRGSPGVRAASMGYPPARADPLPQALDLPSDLPDHLRDRQGDEDRDRRPLRVRRAADGDRRVLQPDPRAEPGWRLQLPGDDVRGAPAGLLPGVRRPRGRAAALLPRQGRAGGAAGAPGDRRDPRWRPRQSDRPALLRRGDRLPRLPSDRRIRLADLQHGRLLDRRRRRRPDAPDVRRGRARSAGARVVLTGR